MFHRDRFGLMLVCLVVFIPASVSAQTSASVQQAFTPLVLPIPHVRTQEQRACETSATLMRQHPYASFEVLTNTVIEPLDAANPFHREALYRWMAEELIRAQPLPFPVSGSTTSADVLVRVRRMYTVAQIGARLCARLPVLSGRANCELCFAWEATFQRTPWCAAADRGQRLRPGDGGIVPGTLNGRICIAETSATGANPLVCPRTSRPLTIRTTPPASDSTGDAFGYGGLGSTGTEWGGGGTGESELNSMNAPF